MTLTVTTMLVVLAAAGVPELSEPDPSERSASREARFRETASNARLASEQFSRCRRFVAGWLAQADPRTGLIPRNLGRDRDIWNPQDAAADNYPFMVLTAAITDRPLFEGRMLDILRTETHLTSRIGRLPDTWSFSKHGFRSERPNLDAIIFGASEYVKDGLMPLAEWLGESPWYERMVGIVDDILDHAPVETAAGKIPSTNMEVNGEMLQVLSRLYWMTGEEKYLKHAVRLGDYYLLGGHHPTRDTSKLRLRDHGSEIVSGLCELYVAVHFADPDRKKSYDRPIHEMCDRILEVGRDGRGMLYDSIDPRSGEHAGRIADTWGYVYNGIYTVYLIDGTEAYRDAVRHVLSSLPELASYHWGSADEYADAIEGALQLLNREPVPAAAQWADSEIADMWKVQRPDGVLEGWHGDGNSARTGILYALWKTQGLTLRPWRADVHAGAVRNGPELLASIRAGEPWSGELVFDKPRHKIQMRLPIDYPRINQLPEWFPVDPSGRYEVEDVSRGTTSTVPGTALTRGLSLQLEGGEEKQLRIAPAVP